MHNIARQEAMLSVREASASLSVLKQPTDKKVSVAPIRGSPIRGVDKTSPSAPDPFAAGRNTL